MANSDDILKRLDGIEDKNDTAHKAMYTKLEALGKETAVDGERIEATRERCDERDKSTTRFMWGVGGTVLLAAAGFVAKALVG